MPFITLSAKGLALAEFGGESGGYGLPILLHFDPQ